ncbi:MAG: MFS transporter [Chloroflexia bacterium]|nr:MFS transporter [Chloroflexia bacterium]
MDECVNSTGSLRSPRMSGGWVQVIALSGTETVSWGVLYYAFAVFLVPMREDLGWGSAGLTGAFSLALLVAGVAGIPVGRWLDRHGPRALMTSGSTLGALLVLAWAAVDSVPLFYLVWAGIGLAMAAVLYEPAFAVVAVWFPERGARSRALTVLTFVGGFASVIFIPLASWLIGQLGWRSALVVLATILALTTIPPHALLLRARPAIPSVSHGETTAAPSRTLREALQSAAFWLLGGGFFLLMAAVVAVTIHLIPYLLGRGFSTGFAAGAAGLVGLLALPGRLIFTPLGAVVPRHIVTSLIFLLEAAAIVVLVGADTRFEVMLFVVLFGAGFGAITPARAALVADLYGPAAFGSISGVLGALVTGARALAPVGTSALVAWWGGYTPVLWFLAALAALAAALVLFANEGPRTEV